MKNHKVNEVILDFYQEQSKVTDPGRYEYLFEDLPRNVGGLKEIIQGLIMHFWDGKLLNYSIPIKRLFEVDTRYVEKMLEKITKMSQSSLTESRSIENRFVGSCGDYATLLCSMLRYQGIPARTRISFSMFYFKDYYHDETIVQYWNSKLNRWCIIDPRVTLPHIKKQNLKISFDLLDVPQDQLAVAGLAWKMARKDPSIVNKFCGGDIERNNGYWYIRDRLIQDLAALNKKEMLLWDCWGLMLRDRDMMDDEEQVKLLDYVADLTINPDSNFDLIEKYYKKDEFSVPNTIISFSPVLRKKEVQVTV